MPLLRPWFVGMVQEQLPVAVSRARRPQWMADAWVDEAGGGVRIGAEQPSVSGCHLDPAAHGGPAAWMVPQAAAMMLPHGGQQVIRNSSTAACDRLQIMREATVDAEPCT